MRVNETFLSLQGEGYFTGTPAFFLRLSGCNLKCPFCDTQHQTYREMTEDEIVELVKNDSSIKLEDDLLYGSADYRRYLLGITLALMYAGLDKKGGAA